MKALLPYFLIGFAIIGGTARGDELIYSYDGDLLPYDPSEGWIAGECSQSCFESIEDGFFVLRWPELGDWPTYHLWIAQPPIEPPVSLWVEWRFRSNHPLPPHSYQCDAAFVVNFRQINELVYTNGDAVISFSGSDYVTGLPNNEFRTYRFESVDGLNYLFSVDGLIFRQTSGTGTSNGHDYLQFRGAGGCLDDWIPNKENAWDFVRYGTVGQGEQIVESLPAAGFVDARQHPQIDRITVRFDTPNYVYLDEIQVKVTDGVAPTPTYTRRLDNGPSDVVEILLDRPIPYNATTTFRFDDGGLVQSLELTYAPGDSNGDGQANLSDFAAFDGCIGFEPTSVCPVFDFEADSDVDLLDFAEFQNTFGS